MASSIFIVFVHVKHHHNDNHVTKEEPTAATTLESKTEAPDTEDDDLDEITITESTFCNTASSLA